ncbi:hypothetical protein AMAG_00969 [Allomyces macrogynus ATCC 38327]|uniref:Uncharacterized protein n=1 Tax=Allomyces macrogynus (strain ATCC 38327) TaxID=578462 RepID=A0A0L0RY09_ALLM3|nr:hypothetical protein AMAG_00969 [Allomyces macrogynus ATCC 38327]|eukprot:KNE55030.1 hypothetical protein AMAG_00969 [Allomyces macrogynus ATCC 38327]
MARRIWIPGTCAIQMTYKELGDPSRMFARRAPTYSDSGSPAQVESFRVMVTLKVFHRHQPSNKTPCLDMTTVVVKEFKIIFHFVELPAWYGMLLALGDTGRAVDDDEDAEKDALDEFDGAYSLADEAFGDDEYMGSDE